MLLGGEIAVITGGASQRGIGRAIAALFAEHGARVAILTQGKLKVTVRPQPEPEATSAGFQCVWRGLATRLI